MFHFKQRSSAWAITATLALAPAGASAQGLSRFAVHLEGGAGTMLSPYQRDQLGYGLMAQGAARLAFTVAGPLAVQLSGESWFAPGSQQSGQQLSALGGLRVEPRVGRVTRLFVDANAGLGQSIDLSRVALSAGLGAEFSLGAGFAVGPVARFGALFATSQDYPSDALYWSAGVSASWRYEPRERPAPPPDRDADGVIDARDLCPTVPAGPHPDASRAGCPTPDTDADGVLDPDDQCPSVAAGPRPDATRPGCPTPDTDADGVLDPDDQCPTAPAGPHPDPTRAGCADGDQDNDRVTDHADQCPTEPAGAHPDPARAGCPLPDADHDAIPDGADACPSVPGAPSTNPRRHGCPGLVRIEQGRIRILRPVFFATNRDTILPRSTAVLTAVAEALRAEPALRTVSIEGHTDDVADDAFNLALSQRRADRVRDALVRMGIAAERLQTVGYGETRPVMEGRSRQARAANRRVEFRITEIVADEPGGAR